jgi:DNA replication protein DnaC
MKHPDALQERAKALHLHGLVAHWSEAVAAGWAQSLINWEDEERARRSLERRIKEAHIGRFKPLCDFEWDWPTAIDRATFEALMTLDFLKDATNVVLVGPNGVGKSTLGRNLAYQALIHGHTVLFTSAGQLLGELAALDSDSTLRRRLRHYASPALLCVDEVGYLSYSNRHADLLFELISRRYEQKSTIVTTNRKCGGPHLRFWTNPLRGICACRAMMILTVGKMARPARQSAPGHQTTPCATA